MQVAQKKDYFGDPSIETDLIEKDRLKLASEKMRRKVVSYGKQYKEFP